MSGVSVEVARMASLEAENIQLKAELIQLKERVERLEEALGVARAPVSVGLSSSNSSNSSSLASLIHPSSPLLASTVQGSREVKADIQEVEQLLQHVAYGEQEEAENLIRKKPKLLLCKGTVTDLSKREFKEITAFQYALWGMDWHMWTMIRQYLPVETQRDQWVALESKGTEHGKHYDIEPVTEALQAYLDNAQKWRFDFPPAFAQWCKLGRAQKLVPAHVVNEYVRSDRAFVPCPQEWESKLPRSRAVQVYDGSQSVMGSWFIAPSLKESLGSTYAFTRYNGEACGLWGSSTGLRDLVGWEWQTWSVMARGDLEALQSLWKMRQQQLEALKTGLAYFTGLVRHLPPVLSEIIMRYLSDDSGAVSIPRM